MSRSRRKVPKCGVTTATSEKEDKQIHNRRLRHKVAQALRVDPDAEVLPHANEVTEVWSMAKDGKKRFDPDEFPEYMRK